VGQTPILREWWTRDHLSAIAAISPEGKLYFHSQDHAIDSADVIAFLEHLLREVPGRIIIIWDGAPIHRSYVIQEFLAHGAAQRIHVERLPAYAPELNPGEQIPPDLVVKSQGIDIAGVISSLMRPSNVVQTLCRNRKSRIKLLSLSEDHWSTTKSDGMWEILVGIPHRIWHWLMSRPSTKRPYDAS
jgi:hypothetical protein